MTCPTASRATFWASLVAAAYRREHLERRPGHDEGQARSLNQPGPAGQPGRPVYVLYLSDAPQVNALYPHL